MSPQRCRTRCNPLLPLTDRQRLLLPLFGSCSSLHWLVIILVTGLNAEELQQCASTGEIARKLLGVGMPARVPGVRLFKGIESTYRRVHLTTAVHPCMDSV